MTLQCKKACAVLASSKGTAGAVSELSQYLMGYSLQIVSIVPVLGGGVILVLGIEWSTVDKCHLF